MFLILKSNSEFVSVSIRALMQKDCVVVHVTRYEADDLNIRTGKTKFLGCWILEAICGYNNEEVYSSLTVVRRVV